jgi:opacity protein-like surface antigen
MRRRALLSLMILGGVLAGSPYAEAGKVDVSFGYFSISATTSKSSGELSNLGSYAFNYRHEVLPSVEAFIGYSLVMASIVGGDMSYGLDLGASWYPMTRAAASHWSSETAHFTMLEIWRPFVSGGFSQRQIRQTPYAGLAGGAGMEYSLSSRVSLRVEGRYLLLVGPSPAKANQLDLLTGVSFSL